MAAVYLLQAKTPMPKLWLRRSVDVHLMTVIIYIILTHLVDRIAGETNEIAARIRRATMNINVEIETLLEFLTHKGAIG